MNILIVEDLKIVRDSIKLVLEESAAFDTILEAADGNMAIDVVKGELPVQIVLTNNKMPGMDGISLTQLLAEIRPDIKVIMMSTPEGEQEITKAFAAGLKGYLLKSINPQELIYCIRHVAKGASYLSSELAMKYFHKSNPEAAPGYKQVEISSRETEILSLMARGLTSTEISDRLFLGKRSIEGCRKDLIDKTGTKNTAELIYYAVSNNLIS